MDGERSHQRASIADPSAEIRQNREECAALFRVKDSSAHPIGTRMPSHPQRIDEFSATYHADRSVIQEARHAFYGWLDDWLDDDDAAQDMVLVLSELLANAVDASPDPKAAIQVRGCTEDGRDVVVEVRNATERWVSAERRWDLDDPLRLGGRGLLIVGSLVDDLELEHDPRNRTTTVRALRALT
jgi:anti-sigma regulatory factor (Ser/Thr protein kinase)